MKRMFPVAAVVAVVGFGAAAASAWANQGAVPVDHVIPDSASTLAFSLEEMNCMSTDLRVTNSIPCSSKGSNPGRPSTKRR